ncbi:MOSC domain-containing protein [Roseivirga sp.]|uniref:MOSC domain-containing protein n=1 Tax=Roseivirga sp. TaxID=1964215 RepID=UPI003B8E65CA
MKSIEDLMRQFAQPGKVEIITIRPERRAAPEIRERVNAKASVGLEGDHYASKGGKRQVTIIALEHLRAAASMLGKEKIDPLLTRRNIVTTGINLLALKHKKFRIGDAVLEYTGECHPCSRMEENFGKGGYNAMRGHGGITCKIIASGEIGVGDSLVVLD